MYYAEHDPTLTTMLTSMVLDTSGSIPVAFAEDANVILTNMRSATADVVTALPQPVRKAADLSRVLDINNVLAWNVYRMISAPDALSIGPYLPGPGMFRKFIVAAEARGVPAAMLTRANESFQQLEDFVREHASSRTAFVSMLSDLNGVANPKEDLKHRRTAYRSNQHIYGLHAEVYMHCHLQVPARDGIGYDLASFRGYERIQRTRSARTSLISENIFSSAVLPTAGPSRQSTEPLDPSLGPLIPTLLKQFCSNPIPELKVLPLEEGRTSVQLHSHNIGSSSALTYYTGIIQRNFSPVESSSVTSTSQLNAVNMPFGLHISDFWMHKSIWPELKAHVELFASRNPPGAPKTPSTLTATTAQLPSTEIVANLGYGLGNCFVPEVPRYSEMVSYTAERLGCDINDMRLYRCRVDYPVMMSWIRVVFDNLTS